MGNMFEWQAIRGEKFLASRDVALSRQLNPDLLSFDGWLAKYAARIPLG